MWMIDPKRELFCGNVIAQHQIQLIAGSIFTRDRRNGVVRLSICLRIDESCLIRITAPCSQHLLAQVNQAVRIFTAQT